jgi:GNAT superfamily N-acetyltransferase
MDIPRILSFFDTDQRRDFEYAGATRQVTPHLVRHLQPPPEASFILWADLDEENADEVIDGEIAYFRQRGHSFDWKVYAHDRPADLLDRLVTRGFETEEPDDVMVLEVASAGQLAANNQADVRRLSDPAQLADVVGILEPVWNEDFDWVYERLGGHMAIPGYLSVYVAYVDGVPACTGWTYFSQGRFAGLWGGSTLEAYRGHGLYSAVLAARIREARERGVPYLTIDAGPMSRPIVARHGFVTITTATECSLKIGEEGESINAVA